jgi:phage gp37-like protein
MTDTPPPVRAATQEAEIEIDRAKYVPRGDLDKALRELHEVKHKRADYIAAVMDAASEAIARIHIEPVPAPPRDRRRAEEVAVALLSDMQTGKVTPDYNSEICRERTLRYARKIVSLAELQRKDHPVRRCVVAMLGDMVEGVDIFPGQQWLLDSTLYRQIFETTPTIIVDFLRILLAGFETVEVQAVQGNHGRIGRNGSFGPEDNSDRMVYRLVKMLMRDEPRLQFEMADPQGERAWYKVIHVGKYRAMLIHGDQIRGSNGYPWYGLGKKVHSWAAGGIDESFDDIYLGHYHQLGAMPLNKRVAWANGAIESTNTFAAETMAAQSDPKQWLLFVHPERGRVTAAYPVYLLGEK